MKKIEPTQEKKEIQPWDDQKLEADGISIEDKIRMPRIKYDTFKRLD